MNTTTDRAVRTVAGLIVAVGILAPITTVAAIAYVGSRTAAPEAPALRNVPVGSLVPLPIGRGDRRPTLAIYFRSDCAVCQRNSADIRALVLRAEEFGASVRFVGQLGRESQDQAYVAKLSLGDRTVTHRDMVADGITAVPTVAVLSAAGTVEFARQGAVDAEGHALFLDALKRLSPADRVKP